MILSWMRISADGQQSRTLFMVGVSWALVSLKYLFAGATLPVFGTVPPMTAAEYGTATALILAIWLGREWKEAHFNKEENK